jgi:hypothetical protein
VRDWAKIESERKRGRFRFLDEERLRAIVSISTQRIVFSSFFFFLFFFFWDDRGV